MTAFLDLPAPDHGAGTSFWLAATGTSLSPSRGEHDEFATLVPADGDPYLRVQRVDGRGGVHLDLHVDDVIGFAWRAVSLGATEVARPSDELVVLQSPGGLPFCVVGEPGAVRPTIQPGLVDQVCLDITPSAFEAEAIFWAELTSWEPRQSNRREFVYLVRPAGQPLRLLLQRLDDERPGPVTAHLDLAAGAEVEAVVAAHVALGARQLRRTASWVTMRDPVGREYCITRRDPVTGLLGE